MQLKFSFHHCEDVSKKNYDFLSVKFSDPLNILSAGSSTACNFNRKLHRPKHGQNVEFEKSLKKSISEDLFQVDNKDKTTSNQR